MARLEHTLVEEQHCVRRHDAFELHALCAGGPAAQRLAMYEVAGSPSGKLSQTHPQQFRHIRSAYQVKVQVANALGTSMANQAPAATRNKNLELSSKTMAGSRYVSVRGLEVLLCARVARCERCSCKRSSMPRSRDDAVPVSCQPVMHTVRLTPQQDLQWGSGNSRMGCKASPCTTTNLKNFPLSCETASACLKQTRHGALMARQFRFQPLTLRAAKGLLSRQTRLYNRGTSSSGTACYW